MNLRPRLNYANVVATLALALAITGGTAYAVSKLASNSVKSKNIAKGAVKGSDIAKNAVTGPKVKKESIGSSDLTAEVLAKLQAEVTGSASAGPVTGLTTNTFNPLPLTGTTSFTPQAGEVGAIAAEAQYTVQTNNVAAECSPDVRLFVNGEPTAIFVSPETGQDSPVPVQSLGRDASGPFGLINPGTPLNVTAEIRGDTDCTAAATLEKLQVSFVQIR